ncbi:hypothetical protein AA0116_g10030 [Alternaria tenuissima]|nr:hypothetical protein AA0116_g10030 [Alternaria tenuissima]
MITADPRSDKQWQGKLSRNERDPSQPLNYAL